MKLSFRWLKNGKTGKQVFRDSDGNFRSAWFALGPLWMMFIRYPGEPWS